MWYSLDMSYLKDAHLEDVPIGSLVFQSSSARATGNGGYLLDGFKVCVKDDSQLFPAIVINPRSGLLATPTGLKCLSRWSLISVVK